MYKICEICRFWAAPVVPENAGDCRHPDKMTGTDDWYPMEADDTCEKWSHFVMHDFDVIPEHGDSFEFHIETSTAGVCRLFAVMQTERGPRHSDLAWIVSASWRKISKVAVRELAEGMGESERAKATPKLKTGANRLSPFIGRELVLLLWALQERETEAQLETILYGWRELAREERWWLYAKAAAPGQRLGTGWRRALFHALVSPGLDSDRYA